MDYLTYLTVSFVVIEVSVRCFCIEFYNLHACLLIFQQQSPMPWMEVQSTANPTKRVWAWDGDGLAFIQICFGCLLQFCDFGYFRILTFNIFEKLKSKYVLMAIIFRTYLSFRKKMIDVYKHKFKLSNFWIRF